MNRSLTHFWKFFLRIYTSEITAMGREIDSDVIVQTVQMLSNVHHVEHNKHVLCHYAFEAKHESVNHED